MYVLFSLKAKKEMMETSHGWHSEDQLEMEQAIVIIRLLLVPIADCHHVCRKWFFLKSPVKGWRKLRFFLTRNYVLKCHCRTCGRWFVWCLVKSGDTSVSQSCSLQSPNGCLYSEVSSAHATQVYKVSGCKHSSCPFSLLKLLKYLKSFSTILHSLGDWYSQARMCF